MAAAHPATLQAAPTGMFQPAYMNADGILEASETDPARQVSRV